MDTEPYKKYFDKYAKFHNEKNNTKLKFSGYINIEPICDDNYYHFFVRLVVKDFGEIIYDFKKEFWILKNQPSNNVNVKDGSLLLYPYELIGFIDDLKEIINLLNNF